MVGTLKPQNFQLVDLASEKMDIISDSPIGIGEPHYVQAIRADRINAWEVYPPGTNPTTMEPDPNAIAQGAEKVERTGNRWRSGEVFAAVASPPTASGRRSVIA